MHQTGSWSFPPKALFIAEFALREKTYYQSPTSLGPSATPAHTYKYQHANKCGHSRIQLRYFSLCWVLFLSVYLGKSWESMLYLWWGHDRQFGGTTPTPTVIELLHKICFWPWDHVLSRLVLYIYKMNGVYYCLVLLVTAVVMWMFKFLFTIYNVSSFHSLCFFCQSAC